MKNPTRAEIVAFYDKFLEYMKSKHDKPNARHTYVCKKHLAALIKPAAKVLDLGCGIGVTSLFIAKRGATVTAIDISPKLIEFAKQKSAHENITYAINDITDMGYNERQQNPLGYLEKYDLITLIDVFEHLSKAYIGQLLRNLISFSHDETVVYLNIPDGRYQTAAYKYIPKKLQIIDEIYSIPQILYKFSEYGFEVVYIDIYGVNTMCQYNSFVFKRKSRLDERYAQLADSSKQKDSKKRIK